MRLALQHKDDLSVLTSTSANLKADIELKQGMSVGAVWLVYEIARLLGIEKALGTERTGKLALWQVVARVIDQGSRLSAVRLAQAHAACDILAIRREFRVPSPQKPEATPYWELVGRSSPDRPLYLGPT